MRDTTSIQSAHTQSSSPSRKFSIPVSSLMILFFFLQLTHFLLLLLLFLSGMPILLLAADAPAGQDAGVTEAKAEPRVAGRGVSHVQSDWLVAVVKLKGGHQQGEVQVKVGPFGIVPKILGVEVQDALTGPAREQQVLVGHREALVHFLN